MAALGMKSPATQLTAGAAAAPPSLTLPVTAKTPVLPLPLKYSILSYFTLSPLSSSILPSPTQTVKITGVQ